MNSFAYLHIKKWESNRRETRHLSSPASTAYCSREALKPMFQLLLYLSTAESLAYSITPRPCWSCLKMPRLAPCTGSSNTASQVKTSVRHRISFTKPTKARQFENTCATISRLRVYLVSTSSSRNVGSLVLAHAARYSHPAFSQSRVPFYSTLLYPCPCPCPYPCRWNIHHKGASVATVLRLAEHHRYVLYAHIPMLEGLTTDCVFSRRNGGEVDTHTSRTI